MKVIIVLGLLFGLCMQPLQGQSRYVDGTEKIHSHPRLLLFKGEEKTLQKQINKSAGWKSVHLRLIEEANFLLNQPVNERKMVGRRLLGVSRDNLKRIFVLSYAYRMTKDQKYATRAEKEMLKAASFQDWNPKHFLDVGEMTMALAIGYDWLYDLLSDETRRVIEDAIIEKGLKPSYDERYNWFVDAVHNWNQVCHAGMTYGALALWDAFSIWIISHKSDQSACDTLLFYEAGLCSPAEAFSPVAVYSSADTFFSFPSPF